MNSHEKASLRIRFKLKIHEADGQKFEDLFTSIMNYAEPDFRGIKPWGNIGDRKNDGYIKTKGIFYQVFAPEDIRKNYTDVVKKLEADFKGLLAQWEPVNEFYFLVNDKYKDVNADCEQAFERIKSNHKLNSAGFKTAKDLENILFTLDDDQIFTIVSLPDPLNIQLKYSVLDDIINHLSHLPLAQLDNSKNVYPNWDEKIKFNNLGDCESSALLNGSFQTGSLDEYLMNQSTFFAEEIKDKLQKIYITLKEDKLKDNDLFWKMVEMISPRSESTFQASTIILMAKYFETCDIFEEPK